MKEHIREIAGSYFISVTLINLAIFTTGMLFRPEQTFGYEAFLSPLLLGLFTVIPTLLLYSKKELTVRQLADTFLRLRDKGAENIDLVTPTHFVPSIIEALDLLGGFGAARTKGALKKRRNPGKALAPGIPLLGIVF